MISMSMNMNKKRAKPPSGENPYDVGYKDLKHKYSEDESDSKDNTRKRRG